MFSETHAHGHLDVQNGHAAGALFSEVAKSKDCVSCGSLVSIIICPHALRH